MGQRRWPKYLHTMVNMAVDHLSRLRQECKEFKTLFYSLLDELMHLLSVGTDRLRFTIQSEATKGSLCLLLESLGREIGRFRYINALTTNQWQMVAATVSLKNKENAQLSLEVRGFDVFSRW